MLTRSRMKDYQLKVMERSDLIEMVRQGKHYMDKSEQARWRVMEYHQRYGEAMIKLDKLRRRMVFVENGTPDALELVNILMELEEIREEKKGIENKLKVCLTNCLSYTLSAVESMNIDSTYLTSQISFLLRQAVMLIRSIRELNIDFSSIYAQAITTKIKVRYTHDEDNRMNYGDILRYLNQLINSIE